MNNDNNDISVLHNLHERHPLEIELKILENTQFDKDLLFKVFDSYKNYDMHCK